MGVNLAMSAKATRDDVEPTTEADTRLGADVSFPFDRMTVEQFRKRFPRARWSEARQAWFVPGPTASRRFTRWLAELEAEADAFADAKGRDAFEFCLISRKIVDPTPRLMWMNAARLLVGA